MGAAASLTPDFRPARYAKRPHRPNAPPPLLGVRRDVVTKAGLNLLVRPATAADMDMIYDNWLRTFRRSQFGGDVRKSVYHDRQRERIDRLLRRPLADLRIASNPDSEFVAYGWALVEGPAVHYAFVKDGFRRLGVVQALLADMPADFVYSHRNGLAKFIVDAKWPEAIYDPYLVEGDVCAAAQEHA